MLAITNARIYPVTQADDREGHDRVRAARIEALGADVAVPAGAKVVDAAGADVYPGFINARNSSMGLTSPARAAIDDDNEMLDFNPQLRTRVAYHTESDAIP